MENVIVNLNSLEINVRIMFVQMIVRVKDFVIKEIVNVMMAFRELIALSKNAQTTVIIKEFVEMVNVNVLEFSVEMNVKTQSVKIIVIIMESVDKMLNVIVIKGIPHLIVLKNFVQMIVIQEEYAIIKQVNVHVIQIFMDLIALLNHALKIVKIEVHVQKMVYVNVKMDMKDKFVNI